MEVNVCRLTESSCYQACFELVDSAIRVVFDFEDPFACDRFPAQGKIHHYPCACRNEIVELFGDSKLPPACMRSYNSLVIRLRFKDSCSQLRSFTESIEEGMRVIFLPPSLRARRRGCCGGGLPC